MMGHSSRQDVAYTDWQSPVSSWHTHNASTAGSGFRNYGNRQNLNRMRYNDKRSVPMMLSALPPKQSDGLFSMGHPQSNSFTEKYHGGLRKYTLSDYKMQRIFEDQILRTSVPEKARISGSPVQMMTGSTYRMDSLNEFREAGGLANNSQPDMLDDQRIEAIKVMEEAKREFILKQTQTQRNNLGMTLTKPMLNITMKDNNKQEKQYPNTNVIINSVLPHAHHREIESFKKMSTKNDDLLSLSSKFQSIVTSEPPEDTKSKRSFFSKLTFSRRKKQLNLNDQPSCSNQSSTQSTQNPKFGFLKRLFGNRT